MKERGFEFLRRKTKTKILLLNETGSNKDSNIADMKENYSISESLKALDSLRSHLQALGESSQSFSIVESLENIFLQHEAKERNKKSIFKQKIDLDSPGIS